MVFNQHGYSSCATYDDGNHPAIQNYKINKGENLSFLSEDTWIVYVIAGQVEFSFGEHTNKKISDNQMVVFLSGYHTALNAQEDSHIISIRISSHTQLCDCFSIEYLLEEKTDEQGVYQLSFLDANSMIKDYMYMLDTYINHGFRCKNLLEVKIQELFFLLLNSYSKRELFHFFYFYLSNDMGFSNLVKTYSYKARNVQELADLTNYSLSGFRKRFKRVFGISAYQWLTNQRSKNILHEIVFSPKSLKEISDEYGFSSPSHFNDFCKSHYKTTPGAIRRKRTGKSTLW